MAYVIKPTSESVRNTLAQIDLKLHQIDVKGDAVIFLSQARMMLKALADSIEEIEVENDEVDGKEE